MEGIKLLQEIYSDSPDHRRECTYYIAMGYYKLGNYGHARKFNGEFLICIDLPLVLLFRSYEFESAAAIE